jgi:hypothetical protein
VPPMHIQCTCSCRSENSAFSPQAESWNDALEQHKGNLISLVTQFWPIVAWFRQLLRAPSPESGQMGYRLSLAEMHRMYMRALQIELVKMGVALQFDHDGENASSQKEERLKGARKYALENLQPALGKYSTERRTQNYI